MKKRKGRETGAIGTLEPAGFYLRGARQSRVLTLHAKFLYQATYLVRHKRSCY